MPKFSVRGVWQQWRESYPLEGGKSDRPITVFTGVRSLALIVLVVLIAQVLVSTWTSFWTKTSSCRRSGAFQEILAAS